MEFRPYGTEISVRKKRVFFGHGIEISVFFLCFYLRNKNFLEFNASSEFDSIDFDSVRNVRKVLIL